MEVDQEAIICMHCKGVLTYDRNIRRWINGNYNPFCTRRMASDMPHEPFGNPARLHRRLRTLRNNGEMVLAVPSRRDLH